MTRTMISHGDFIRILRTAQAERDYDYLRHLERDWLIGESACFPVVDRDFRKRSVLDGDADVLRGIPVANRLPI